jgi:hypothetical protein
MSGGARLERQADRLLRHEQRKERHEMNATGIREFGALHASGEIVAETLPSAEFQTLGSIGSAPFALHKPSGREFRLGAELQPWDYNNPARPGTVRIHFREPRKDALGRLVPTEFDILATEVRTGLYATLAKREAARQAKTKRAKPYRYVDALAFAFFDRQETTFRVLGASSPPTQSTDARGNSVYIDPAPFSRSTTLLKSGGSEAVRGPAAMLAWFDRHGVRFELVGGALVTSSIHALGSDHAECIRRATSLFATYLSGHPLTCALPHKGTAPEAITVAWPSLIGVCSEHRDALA